MARRKTSVRAMTVELADIGSLRLDASNARTHDERNIVAIAESLRRFGQRFPIVVRGEAIVAGNGRFLAAKRLGWKQVQIVRADDLSDEEARAFAIADNRTAELGEWDGAALAEALQVLGDEDAALLAATGFTESDIAALLRADEASALDGVEAEPDVTGSPRTRRAADDVVEVRFLLSRDDERKLLARLRDIRAAHALETNSAAIMVLVSAGRPAQA